MRYLQICQLRARNQATATAELRRLVVVLNFYFSKPGLLRADLQQTKARNWQPVISRRDGVQPGLLPSVDRRFIWCRALSKIMQEVSDAFSSAVVPV